MADRLDLIEAGDALKTAEYSFGLGSLELAPFLEHLGSSYHAQAMYAQAEECYTRALKIRRQGVADESVLTILHKLGVLNRVQAKFANAKSYYLEALQLSEKLYGGCSLEVAQHNNYLAGLLYSCGQFDQAEQRLDASIKLYEAISGDHSVAIGLCRFALALLKRRGGNDEAATAQFQQAKRLLLSVVRDMHAAIEDGLILLAVRHFELQETDKAEILLRHYIVIEDRLWPYHPLVSASYYELAEHFCKTGDFDSAESCYTRVLERQQELLVPADPQILETLKRLAVFYLKQGNKDKAMSCMMQALGIRI